MFKYDLRVRDSYLKLHALETPHETQTYLHYQTKNSDLREREREREKKGTDEVPHTNLAA